MEVERDSEIARVSFISQTQDSVKSEASPTHREVTLSWAVCVRDCECSGTKNRNVTVP
jgi:hypothetical protein